METTRRPMFCSEREELSLSKSKSKIRTVMVTDRSCSNKLVTTELVVQCRKSQVTYAVTGMKNLQKRKVR